MADQKPLEGAPQAGPDSGAEGNKTLFDKDKAGPYADYFDRLQNENQKWRLKTREAEARTAELENRLSELEKQQQKAQTQRLAENEQWKELAEQREQELQSLTATREAEKAKAAQHLITAHTKGLLASAGITDAAKQALLLPGILSQVEASVGDDFAVQGEFSKAIDTAIETLGLKKPSKQAPPDAASILQGQLPSKSKGQPMITDPYDDLTSAFQELARRG